MYQGTRFKIGEEEYIVPPLSLGQLRGGILEKLREHDQLVNDGRVFEGLALRADVILAALRRNYPEFPEDKLLDWLDMSNTGPIWLAILGASGLSPLETERPALPEKLNGTFAQSTEASQQPTAGPIGR